MKYKLLILIVLAVAVLATVISRRRPALQIDTAGLDPKAAQLIQAKVQELGTSPRSGEAWGELGALLKSYELREPALRCLKEAERLEPREPRWPYLIGLTLERPSEAIVKLRRAAELSEHPAVRLRLGNMLAEDGQLDAAQRVLEQGLKHPPTRLALAHVARQRGDWQRAEELARACAQDPRTAQGAWMLLGTLYQRSGKVAEATEAAQRASQLPPQLNEPDPFETEAMAARGDTRWLSDRVQRHLRDGEFVQARELIAQLQTSHPDFAETWLLLGRLQLLQKQPVEAEQSIRRHLEMDAQSLLGVFQLGRALQEQQKFAEAAEAFERTTRMKADYGPGWFNLGVSLARAGRRSEAIEPLRQAIRHHPQYLDSYLVLADLRAQDGDADSALDLLNQADALKPGDPRVRAMKRRIESGAANKDLK